MRRAILCLTTVLALAALVLIIARLDFRSPTVTRYAAWDRAYLKRDGPAMERILAPEFHLDSASGKRISRAQYVEGLLESPPKNGYYTLVRRVDGEKPGLTVLILVTLPGSDGKSHRYRYRDKWIQRNGVWLIIERSRSWDEPHL